MTNKPVYLNVTEIQGMPMIIINAYEGLVFLLCLVFIKWISFAIGQTCKRQADLGPDTPVARAVQVGRPPALRRLGDWLDDITTPTSQRTSIFSDTDVESKTSEPDIEDPGSPTAASILPTGADATLDNEGRVSYG